MLAFVPENKLLMKTISNETDGYNILCKNAKSNNKQMSDAFEEAVWSMIDAHFVDNPQSLVRHHIDSYNDFTMSGISQLLRETNPIKVDLEYNVRTNNFGSSAKLYFGGIEGDRVFFGKPVIYDHENVHFMFPNEARLRNMTYSMPIYCDVDVYIEQIVNVSQDAGTSAGTNDGVLPVLVDEHGFKISSETVTQPTSADYENIKKSLVKRDRNTTIQIFKLPPIRRFICNLPIMVQSANCVLHGLDRQARFALGECKNDIGGYFIIAGKEKTVVCQEIFGNNMLAVEKDNKPDAVYGITAKIRSVSENVAKPVRTLAVHWVNPGAKYTNQNIVVSVPNIRKPVPLFILFRALGIVSDKSIIATCLLRDPDTVEPEVLDWFLPSIHDAGIIFSQADALQYMSVLVKGQTVNRVLYVLADLFLPHVGEVNFRDKAFYLGHMVNELMAVATGAKEPTDRDNFKYKRIEPVGVLLRDLFREYFLIYTANVRRGFESKYEYNKATYADMSVLIETTQDEIFTDYGLDLVNKGIQKAFKGSWGATPKTRRIGVVQDLNRLSFLGYISHLRKTNLPLDPSIKLVGPRVLHGSHWGIIDAIDTPDGGNIGIHKYMSILTYVTRSHSREPLIQWLYSHPDEFAMVPISELSPIQAGAMVKVMVNGFWAGSTDDPMKATAYMRKCRRFGLLPASTSIAFDIPARAIVIYNDGGRLCRPIFYRNEMGEFPFSSGANKLWKQITNESDEDRQWTWTDLISGSLTKTITADKYDPMQSNIYAWSDLYKSPESELGGKHSAVLEYLDTNEAEYTKIAINQTALQLSTADDARRFTHHELHESTCYGVMCNMINYLEHNPVTRNSFSCGQAKQACSVYHSNYQLRMDKTSVLLNNGQIPLVKSRYVKYINNEENPNGVNTIVAIMCYTGYNVEDAILINEGALQRGLFRTTYYSTYEAHEEKKEKGDVSYVKAFANIDKLIAEGAIVGTRPEFEYNHLNPEGLIWENTPVNDRTVLIGLASGTVVSGTANSEPQTTPADSAEMRPALNYGTDPRRDASKMAKKGQMGVVDKAFMTDGDEGQRIAKVRLREDRIPAVGDKVASRAGQKGTIGRVIPERDMPFTAEGIRPDIIINPHAIPSRMTLGQMVESNAGKLCALFGCFADCTAFTNLRKNAKAFFANMLRKMGYHSSGDEIMYNGHTGEQIRTSIFMGPTYYMRLKHMVKDKVNFRARGPNANMTRQPVGGRANDGGLRIGEMERDSVIAHGIAEFLTDSMMERGDKYNMAICNTTGTIAVYNPAERLMYSMAADGPVQYAGTSNLGGSNSDADQQIRLQQITKYGRSFSIVEIPYSLKLLLQELQVLGIQMRLITEDNITQIDSMANSDNITRLVGGVDQVTPQQIAETIRKRLHGHHQKQNKLDITQKKRATESKETDIEPTVGGGQPVVEQMIEDVAELWPTVGADPQADLSHLTTAANREIYGGKDDPIHSENPIQVGGVVHRRGDHIPQRLWTVQNIGSTHGGINHATISTNDVRDLSTSDSILYVPTTDLYAPEPGTIYAAPQVLSDTVNGPFGQAPFVGQAPFGQAPFGQAPFGQAPFGQAPFGQNQTPVVIKLFNGGGVDNSVGGSDGQQTTGSGGMHIPSHSNNALQIPDNQLITAQPKPDGGMSIQPGQIIVNKIP